MGDTFHDGGDPIVRLTSTGDRFTNTRDGVGGGDRFFDIVDEVSQDISWDILNAFLQTTSWDILKENNQDIAWDILNAFAQSIAWDILNAPSQDFAWSIFAKTLYFIQQFFINTICFDFNVRDGETLQEQWEYISTFLLTTPTQFSFSIIKPIQFDFGIATVLHGERDTINLGG